MTIQSPTLHRNPNLLYSNSDYTCHELSADSSLKLRSIALDVVLDKELLHNALDALDPDDGMTLLLGKPQQVAGFPAERNENSSREEM